MKITTLLLAAALLCGTAGAQVPLKLNYQGYLKTPAGAPVNGVVTMLLELYDAPVSGMPLHSEYQMVSVDQGLFNVAIGTSTPLTVPFDIPYYLAITLDGDAQMSPRQPLLASPYALRAVTSEALASSASVGGSQVTGMLSNAQLPTSQLNGTIAGAQIATGAVGQAQIAAGAVTQAKLAPAGATAGMVLGTDGTNLVWKSVANPVLADIAGDPTSSCTVDEFVSGNTTSGSIGALGWNTNAQTFMVNTNRGESSHPGVISFDAGATLAHLRLYADTNPIIGIVNSDTPFDLRWILRRSTAQEPSVQRIGFLEDVTANPPANGMYFEVRGSAENRRWFAVTRASGTSTETDSGLGEGNNWTSLRVRRDPSGITYFIDNNLVGTHTTNIPTAGAIYFNVAVQLQGATGGSLLLDYFSLCFRGLAR